MCLGPFACLSFCLYSSLSLSFSVYVCLLDCLSVISFSRFPVFVSVCLSSCIMSIITVHLSICLSVCLSGCLPVCLSDVLKFVWCSLIMFVFMFVCMPVCLSFSLSDVLFVIMFVHLYVCLPVCLSVVMFVWCSVCNYVCPFVCLSVCLSVLKFVWCSVCNYVLGVLCVQKNGKRMMKMKRERKVTDSLNDSYFLSLEVSIVVTTHDHDRDYVGVWYLLSRKHQQSQFFCIVRGWKLVSALILNCLNKYWHSKILRLHRYQHSQMLRLDWY